jgi:hypothetical protein
MKLSSLEVPTPMKQYLGCGHRTHKGELVSGVRVPGGFLRDPGYKDKLGASTRHTVRFVEYDLVSLVDKFGESYVNLAAVLVAKLSQKAQTPFLEETNAYAKDEPEGMLYNFALKTPRRSFIAPDAAVQIS